MYVRLVHQVVGYDVRIGLEVVREPAPEVLEVPDGKLGGADLVITTSAPGGTACEVVARVVVYVEDNFKPRTASGTYATTQPGEFGGAQVSRECRLYALPPKRYPNYRVATARHILKGVHARLWISHIACVPVVFSIHAGV